MAQYSGRQDARSIVGIGASLGVFIAAVSIAWEMENAQLGLGLFIFGGLCLVYCMFESGRLLRHVYQHRKEMHFYQLGLAALYGLSGLVVSSSLLAQMLYLFWLIVQTRANLS